MSQDPTALRLSLMGDWGVANWHLIAGWIAAGLRWRTSRESRFTIHTLGPYRDSLHALLDRTVDLCVATPVQGVRLAIEGRGTYAEPHPELKVIGVLPHRDRLALAIGRDVADHHGIRSIADIAERKPPLKLVCSLRDGIDLIQFTAERILAGYGIAWEDIERWGGEWVAVERPHHAFARVGKGELDGIFFEAIMNWHKLMEFRALRILPIEPHVLDALHAELGLERADIQPGEFDGVEEVTPVVDFSGWVITVRDDLPDEVAKMIAQVLVEDRADFERRYTHTPLERSALTYPIDPEQICRTELPLHPGAERYYREAGLLAEVTA